MHTMAKEDIIKHQFKEGHKMATGRPKGSKNRSTIVKEWFEVMKTARNPINGLEESLTMEDWLTVMQFHKGITKSDTAAYRALMDSAYGQAKESVDVVTDAPQIDYRTLFNFVDDTGKDSD